MFYRMIVHCCVCVTVVLTDYVSCCISDGDCCCVVCVRCANTIDYSPSDLGSLPIIVDIIISKAVFILRWYSEYNHWL